MLDVNRERSLNSFEGGVESTKIHVFIKISRSFRHLFYCPISWCDEWPKGIIKAFLRDSPWPRLVTLSRKPKGSRKYRSPMFWRRFPMKIDRQDWAVNMWLQAQATDSEIIFKIKSVGGWQLNGIEFSAMLAAWQLKQLHFPIPRSSKPPDKKKSSHELYNLRRRHGAGFQGRFGDSYGNSGISRISCHDPQNRGCSSPCRYFDLNSTSSRARTTPFLSPFAEWRKSLRRIFSQVQLEFHNIITVRRVTLERGEKAIFSLWCSANCRRQRNFSIWFSWQIQLSSAVRRQQPTWFVAINVETSCKSLHWIERQKVKQLTSVVSMKMIPGNFKLPLWSVRNVGFRTEKVSRLLGMSIHSQDWMTEFVVAGKPCESQNSLNYNSQRSGKTFPRNGR